MIKLITESLSENCHSTCVRSEDSEQTFVESDLSVCLAL